MRRPRVHLFPLLVALSAAASVSTLSPLAAPAGAASRGAATLAASGTVWLCQPGAPLDPCAAPLTTTVIDANGSRSVDDIVDAADPKVDCFYVYPTVSTAAVTNTDLTVGPEEIAAAVAEVSPFSQVCRVWAPMYRQETETALIGPGGVINDNKAAEDIAYASVLSAWKDYLAHDNDGRPVVFIGHSQGAAMLIRLLAAQIDPSPARRAKLVSAIILGGNVQVPTGKAVGGVFKHIPACRSATETGCVIAYSSFDNPPPRDSLFGRPGQGVSLQSDQTGRAGMQVVCTNPAALGGGAGELGDRFYVTKSKILGQRVTTPWVAYPDLYRAQCESRGGATWLQVTPAPGDPRPTVTDAQGPLWGLHAADVNLAVGSLVHDVALEIAAFDR